MNIKMNKKPYCCWDDTGDEFDWDDFKYAIGSYSASRFPQRTCKAVLYTQNPFTGEPRIGKKYFQIGLAKNASEYGRNVLQELFKEIGTLEVYGLSNRKGLVFIHRHHDNPVNGDMIVLTPISNRTYLSHI